DPVCMDAAKDARVLLEDVCGHTVEDAYPDALDELVLLVHFTTVFAASTAYDLRKLAAMAGRDLGPDDVEPVTWAQAELGRAVGAQLVAAMGREDILFRVAAQLEAARPWVERRPPVSA